MFLDKELDVICLLQTELKHSEPLLYKSNCITGTSKPADT